VRERQQQLRSLKSEIESNRKDIEKLKNKEKNLARLQQRLAKDRELTRRYLQELQNQDNDLRSDLATRQVDLLDKEAAARETSNRLRKGIFFYYRMRQVAGPELLFSSRSFGQLFARSQFLARLVYRERVELAALADDRQRIAEASSALEVRRRGVEQLQEEKRREEAYLLRQGLAARAQISEVKDERAERERRVKELEESQAAIAHMIERLERERAGINKRGETPALAGSLAPPRRRLPWPTQGSVVGEFGLEVNPRYGTQVPSNGIDIAAPEHAPIRAVEAGLVEFVDWLPGYGRTVILNHGSGFYTLYAHASTVSVRRGESVAAGQIIAGVGDTDSIKGFCLHFEVREGARALDPRKWLE
jgi:murein hydrolase activator